MEKFNRVTEPMELDFYSIEDDGHGGKQIHVLGYLYTNGEDYGEGPWRDVEFCGFIEPVEEFVTHLKEDDNYVFNHAAELSQYIGDQTDEQAVEIINRYFNGHPADYRLAYSEITTDTPCGDYVY